MAKKGIEMGKKLEHEKYVCLCGGTGFEIYQTHLKCTECSQEYNFYSGYLNIPEVFNGRRDSLKRKTK